MSDLHLRGSWLAWVAEHVTPDLRVVSWSPELGADDFKKKKKKTAHLGFP